MKTVAIRSLILLTGLAFGQLEPCRAQLPVPGASLGFRNDTPIAVIIQGVSVVNNMPRRGQPILVPPGRVAFDVNVPPGPRRISIYDAQQPSRVLLADFPVLVQNREASFSVRPSPLNPDRVVLIQQQ